MKFIPGTRFINKTFKHTKFFKRGIPFTIKNIKLKDGKIEYTFDFIEYEKSIKFNSSEEADKVLSVMI
tara:strand:+ start:201 stop:404 length:204 start_codon:yes stop_codon:yes gene_type:complete